MTNGTVGGKAGANSLTVQYQGASRTIAIPPTVPVTAITATKQPLARGTGVVVVAKKGPDGALSASAVILAPPAPK
jgi:hypothetical protein